MRNVCSIVSLYQFDIEFCGVQVPAPADHIAQPDQPDVESTTKGKPKEVSKRAEKKKTEVVDHGEVGAAEPNAHQADVRVNFAAQNEHRDDPAPTLDGDDADDVSVVSLASEASAASDASAVSDARESGFALPHLSCPEFDQTGPEPEYNDWASALAEILLRRPYSKKAADMLEEYRRCFDCEVVA